VEYEEEYEDHERKHQLINHRTDSYARFTPTFGGPSLIMSEDKQIHTMIKAFRHTQREAGGSLRDQSNDKYLATSKAITSMARKRSTKEFPGSGWVPGPATHRRRRTRKLYISSPSASPAYLNS